MKVIDPVTIDANAPAAFLRTGTAWYWDYAGVLQSAGTDVLRFHWDRETGDYLGVLIESAATNILLNNINAPTNDYQLSTQTRTVSNGATYTLSFYGSGTVTLSGAATGATTGTGANVRTTRTFSTASTSLTLTVSGSVTYAQLEIGSYASSVIVTAGSAVTRNADVISGYGTVYNGFTDSTPTYNPVTAYSYGDVVQYAGRLYESQTPGSGTNTGTTPGTNPLVWLNTGPNNVTAAFDQKIGTVCRGQSAEEVIVIKTASVTDAVGLYGLMDVEFVQIIISYGLMTGHETLYKDGRPSMAVLSAETGGYFVTILVNNGFVGAPPPGYGYAAIGEMVVGALEYGGQSVDDLSGSFIDFSTKTTDEFDSDVLIEGPYKKTMVVNFLVEKAQTSWLYDLLLRLRARPTVWIGEDDSDYESLAVLYGVIGRLDFSLQGQTQSLWTIEIIGLSQGTPV